MANNEFFLGALVRAAIAYNDADGNAADPTSPRVTFVDPSGNATTYTYPTDAEYVQDSTGRYHVDIDADEAGSWYVRGWSTGSGQSATELTFTVKTPLSSEFG